MIVKEKILKLIKRFKGKKVRVALEIETTDLYMDVKELIKNKFDRISIISELNQKTIESMPLNCTFTENELEEIFLFCEKCKLDLVLAKDPNLQAEIEGPNENATELFRILQPVLQEMNSKNLEEILEVVTKLVKSKEIKPDEELKFKFIKPMTGSSSVVDFVIPTKDELIQEINKVVLEDSNMEFVFTQDFKNPLTEEEIALLQMTCSRVDIPSTFSCTFQENFEH